MNATNRLFSGIASIITQLLLVIIFELKVWCKLRMTTYKKISKVETTLYWVIDSLFEFTLNLANSIHNMYIADITRCYESIPLTSADNLHEALAFLIKLAFQQHHVNHEIEHVIWAHINITLGKSNTANGVARVQELDVGSRLLKQDFSTYNNG